MVHLKNLAIALTRLDNIVIFLQFKNNSCDSGNYLSRVRNESTASVQKLVYDPIKHLRWNLLQNQLKALKAFSR